jgi:hypothetical protein
MPHNRSGGFLARFLAITGITPLQAVTGMIFGSIWQGMKKVKKRS